MKKVFTWDLPISVLFSFTLAHGISFFFVTRFSISGVFLNVLLFCLLFSTVAAYWKILLRGLPLLLFIIPLVFLSNIYRSASELLEEYTEWVWAVVPDPGFELLTNVMISFAVSLPVFILVRFLSPAPVFLIIGGILFTGLYIGGFEFPVSLFWAFLLIFLIYMAHTSGAPRRIAMSDKDGGRRYAPGLKLLAALPACLISVAAASLLTVPETDPLSFFREFRFPGFFGGSEVTHTGRGSTAIYTTSVGRELGGPFSPTGQLMLTVRSNSGETEGPYLRGGIGMEYDGRRWQGGFAGYDLNTSSLGTLSGEHLFFNYRITHEGLRGTRLYLPYGVFALTAGDGGDMPSGLVWHTGDILRLSENPGAGLSYEASVYNNSAQFSYAPPVYALFPEENPQGYVFLPPNMPFRVGQLARSLAVYGDDDYHNALAIERYLVENYYYNPDMGRTPEDRDFVDYFLFEQQEGYCTYFATAMAVLCRMIGLPSRYVEGFAPSPEREGELYFYTDERAHAWAEVWLRDRGWTRFEPTPGYNTEDSVWFPEPATPDRPSPPPDLPSPRPSAPGPEIPSEPPPAGPPVRPQGGDGGGISVTPGTVLALTIPPLGLFIIWLALRLRRKRFERMLAAVPYDQRMVGIIYRHLLRLVRHAGIKHTPHETLGEFAARVDEAWPTNLYIMRKVADVYGKSCYADAPLSEEESGTLKRYVDILERREHIHLSRTRYWLYSNILSLLPAERGKHDRSYTFEQ
jgi:hypothetical protein